MNKWLGLIFLSLLTVSAPAFAAAYDAAGEWVPLGVALTFGITAIGGALGQGKAVASALDSIGRNPSAAGTIMVQMLLGLALIESLVIIGFVVCLFLLGKI
jgi:F-type H+-transporting ATPase subunit c